VMPNNLDPRDANREEPQAPKGQARPNPEPEPTLTDREVPLASAQTPEAIHQWLDGEKVNEEQLRAADKAYSFWRRVEQETDRRSRMKTPSSLPGEIMKAIKKDE
jgi:hypothetical protein